MSEKPRVEELMRLGWRLYAEGDVVEAAGCWRSVLELESDHREARRLLELMSVGAEAISAELADLGEDVTSVEVSPAIDVDDGFDMLEDAGPKPIAVPAIRPPSKPGPPRAEADTLMDGARELFDLGDFSGSLALVQQALSIDPFHDEASRYLERNRDTLVRMYESKIGPLDSRPRVLLRPDEILWLNLDHRSGFVLAQLDGTISVEDLYALSGLPRLDTAKILAELLEQGVIAN